MTVGEDLLVPARSLVALAPRVRRGLGEPLVDLPLVALGRRERRDELLVLGLGYFVGSLLKLTEESAYLLRPLVRFPGVVGSKSISSRPKATKLIDC